MTFPSPYQAQGLPLAQASRILYPLALQIMRKIEQLMNQAITDSKDWQQDNTSVFTTGGSTSVFLHGHEIARITHDGVALNNKGWLTKTTKSRMNAILKEHGAGDYVCQKDFQWFIFDGLTKELKEFPTNEWCQLGALWLLQTRGR